MCNSQRGNIVGKLTDANGELTEQQFKDANEEWNRVVDFRDGGLNPIDRKVIKAIAPHVQYATTIPEAPLSDAEWAEARRLTARHYGSDLIMAAEVSRQSISEVLSHRSVVQPANVLLDVLRGPVRADERLVYNSDPHAAEFAPWLIDYRIEHRILKPKEKTVKEKIEEILKDYGVYHIGTMIKEIIAASKSGGAK